MRNNVNEKAPLFSMLVLSWTLLFCVPTQLWSQSDQRSQLESEKKKLEEEIQLTSRLLEETQTKKMRSLNELKIYKKQISLRENLLSKVKKGVADVDLEIEETAEKISTLTEDIEFLKADYAKLAQATYKGLNQRPSAFYIFSSRSLSQAISRIKYFKEFSEFEKQKLEEIKLTKSMLKEKRDELESQKIVKQKLIDEESRETQKLKVAKELKNGVFKRLREDESAFRQQLKDTRNRLNNLNKKITELITLEASKRSKEESDILLPLSKDFNTNQGKLPWPMPVKNGLITNHFGIQTDEEGIKINYEGIDISTIENQAIRAIFGGKVVEAKSLPIIGKVVIIQHGKFYSVYSHLSSIEVEKGATIVKLQRIGRAKTDKNSGETYIHLQIRENTTALNPEKWIVSKK